MISLQQLREHHVNNGSILWRNSIDHFINKLVLNEIKSNKFKNDLPSSRDDYVWMLESECGDFTFIETLQIGCGDSNWLDVKINRTIELYYDTKYPNRSPVGYDSEDVDIVSIKATFGEEEFIIEDQVIKETLRILLK